MKLFARRTALLVATVLVSGLAAFTVTGCSSNSHQIVSDTSVCISCHASDYAVDESGTFNTSGAVYSATGSVTITLDDVSNFYVARAVASNQGSNKQPIPISYLGPISVGEGESYELTLDEGSYLLVVQDDGDRTSQLLIVDADTTETTTDAITLKL